jgi:hypothetical protein
MRKSRAWLRGDVQVRVRHRHFWKERASRSLGELLLFQALIQPRAFSAGMNQKKKDWGQNRVDALHTCLISFSARFYENSLLILILHEE